MPDPIPAVVAEAQRALEIAARRLRQAPAREYREAYENYIAAQVSLEWAWQAWERAERKAVAREKRGK
jgi:hypothetical protein